MKRLSLSLLAIATLAACDGAQEEADTTITTETDAATTPAAVEPTPSLAPVNGAPGAAEIPAAIQGRWGLVAADCEPGRSDAKGLLEITANKLDFYESVGTLDDIKELDETRIRAVFDFIGEGQEWERDVTLEVQEGGTVLIRREDGVDAAPGDFRYNKCG